MKNRKYSIRIALTIIFLTFMAFQLGRLTEYVDNYDSLQRAKKIDRIQLQLAALPVRGMM